ncbi:MAG: SRPBCC family protein [bacterium]|nr:SRPBCC family protein [bacterium]
MNKYFFNKSLFLLLGLTLGAAQLFADNITSYQGEPPRIALSPSEKAKLERFESVYPPVTDEGNSGGGQAVFRVKANPQTVWAVIADFPNYTKYNADLSSADYYKPKQRDFYFVKFVAKKFFVTVNWHVKHNYPMLKKGWGTWELDKSQKNDLTECVGFWRVDPVPGTNYSDVSYSINLASDGFFLNLFKDMLISEGVKKATQWVKKEAERR